MCDYNCYCWQGGAQPVKLISNETEAAEAVRRILSKTEHSQGTRRPPQQHHHHHPVLQPGHHHQPQQPPVVTCTTDLQRSAEEILAGVRRPTHVESAAMVQYVNGKSRDTVTLHNVIITCCTVGEVSELRAVCPVNLSTAPPQQQQYEVAVYGPGLGHQDPALALASLEPSPAQDTASHTFLSLQQF